MRRLATTGDPETCFAGRSGLRYGYLCIYECILHDVLKKRADDNNDAIPRYRFFTTRPHTLSDVAGVQPRRRPARDEI